MRDAEHPQLFAVPMLYACGCCNGNGRQLARLACMRGVRVVTCPQCDGTGEDPSAIDREIAVHLRKWPDLFELMKGPPHMQCQ